MSTYPKTVFSADTLWVGNNALAVTLSQNTITDPLTQTIKKMVGVYANSLPTEPPLTTKLPPIAYNGEGLLRCTIDGKIQYISSSAPLKNWH